MLFERHFYKKINLILISIDLVTNWLLFHFVLSHEAKAKINISGSWWPVNEKYFCFLNISIHDLLQRHAEFNRLFIKKFSYKLLVLVYSFMVILNI